MQRFKSKNRIGTRGISAIVLALLFMTLSFVALSARDRFPDAEGQSVNTESRLATVQQAARECDCGVVWGDVNADTWIDPLDVVNLANYIFKNIDGRVPLPDCPNDPGDVTCDGSVDPLDEVYLILFVFQARDFICADPCL